MLKEYSKKQEKILYIPSLLYFNYDWELLQDFIKSKGNPPYSIGDDLYLNDMPIESLGSLHSVGGNLDLKGTMIKSLGKLKSVGSSLSLVNTPLSKKYTGEEIRQMVDVGHFVFL